MTVLGHNVEVSDQSNNTLLISNTGYFGQAIRMYYNQGIAFHCQSTIGTQGDVFYFINSISADYRKNEIN